MPCIIEFRYYLHRIGEELGEPKYVCSSLDSNDLFAKEINEVNEKKHNIFTYDDVVAIFKKWSSSFIDLYNPNIQETKCPSDDEDCYVRLSEVNGQYESMTELHYMIK